MKTEVIFNESLIKQYYKDLYFRGSFIISLFVLVFGSTGASLYLQNKEIWLGIAVEIITIFILYIFFALSRNNAKIAINSLYSSQRNYYFEFSDTEFIVTIHKDISIFKLANVRYRKLKHMIQFKTLNSKLIYIIPLTNFTKDEWNTIFRSIKNSKKRKGDSDGAR